jgi:hypothetical protein
MKTLGLCLLVALLPCCSTFSQDPFAELQINAGKVDDVQAFAVGDSVFLTYMEKGQKKGYWIDATGAADYYLLNQVSVDPFSGIEKHQDTTFFYVFSEHNKQLMLRVLKQASAGGPISTTRKSFDIRGELVATNCDKKQLLIVVYVKNPGRLEIMQFTRGAQAKTIELPVPATLRRNSGSAAFITQNSLTTIQQGCAPLKIFPQGNTLTLTFDDDRFVTGESKTFIMKLDLDTGTNTRDSIQGPDYHKFTSVCVKDTLYRLTKANDYLELNVYDVKSGKVLYTSRIENEKSLRERKVFQRNGENAEVGYNSLYELISRDGLPSIIAEKTGADTRLVAGTFYSSKTASMPVGFTPLALLVAAAASALDLALQERPGLSWYFAFDGSVRNGFSIKNVEDLQPSLRQIIDRYEIARTSGVAANEQQWNWFLHYKGYLKIQQGALGIYHEKMRKTNKLILLKYRD